MRTRIKRNIFKKKLNLTIFSLLFGFGALAQNSFPTSNAMWIERVDNSYCIYGLLGDTIRNDMVYSKLYHFNDTILAEEYKKAYIGTIRNEGQKVLFNPGWQYPDILLFDFSVNVGDIVYHNATVFYGGCEYLHFTYQPNYYSHIISVDTINEIKRINAGHLFGDWFEGIGSSGGLFGSIFEHMMNGCCLPILECFKHNDTILYPNLIYPNNSCNSCPCNGIINVNNNKTDNNSYLYQNQPNPFSKSTEIKCFISENVKQASILILDMKGILKKQITIKNKGESSTIINANEFQSGTYIYKLVIDGKEIDSKKMILTK